MSEHKHGEMNIENNEKTFEGFVRLTRNVIIVVLLSLLALAMFNG